MDTERNHPNGADDGEAVVTYSRISGSGAAAPTHRRAKAGGERSEPILEAKEVRAPAADTHADRVRAGDGLRARRPGAGDEFVEDSNRSDWMRYGLIAAALALVAGVGVLAASVGVATMVPGGSTSSVSAEGAPAHIQDAGQDAGQTGFDTLAVREIPISTGASAEATPMVAVAPPIPRKRPDDVAALSAGGPDLVEPSKSTVSTNAPVMNIATPENVPVPVQVPTLPAPASGSTGVTTTASAPAAKPQPASGNTDSLISSIENTLAKIDATEPTSAPAPGASSGQAAQPPVAMTEPVYPPPSSNGYPQYQSNAGPYYDVVPPAPVTGDGYYAAPIPPEPVPQAWPQSSQGSQVYGPPVYTQTPGAYPSQSGDIYPPVIYEEAEADRPGIVRRTVAKATDAVGRVFSRD